jgi:chromosome segregation ATPase
MHLPRLSILVCNSVVRNTLRNRLKEQQLARSGIYKSEVIRARDRLTAQGRHPSVDAIRIELGNTGSKSTIQRHLKEIEEEEGGKTGGKVALSESIQDLVLRLAERLQDEADQRIVQLNAEHARALEAARGATKAAQDEASALRETLGRSRSEAAAEKERYEQLAQAHLAGTQARAQAEQRASDLQLQLESEVQHRSSIEAKYADARSSLEHFRDAAKEQREREARQHENQVQFLQQEIHTLKQQVTEHQTKFVQANQELARLTSELGAARRELPQIEQLRRQLNAANEKLVAAQGERDAAKLQAQHAGVRTSEVTEELTQRKSRTQQLEMEVRELERRLAASEARHDSTAQMSAQIRTLIESAGARPAEG